MRKMLIPAVVLLAFAGSVPVLIGQINAQEASPTSIASVGVSAVLMGSTETDGAPGYTMYLQELTFEPGANIPRHTHSGTVLVWVDTGALTFTVYAGELVVTRAPVGDAAGVVETFGAGEVAVLEPGDSSSEQGGEYMVDNATDGTTITRVATLGKTGAPFLDFVQPEE